MNKKTYIVIADAWIYNKHYKKGQRIELTEKQAKYELLSQTIKPAPSFVE